MAENKSKIRATLIELWNRVTDYSKNEKVYHNGYNNLYPNEMERVIMNSPTGRRVQRMMSKTISGKGVINDEVVNPKKGLMTSDVVNMIAEDISIHYGYFIHFSGYSINDEGLIISTSCDILDYSRCRIGKEDDEGNPSKIVYKDYEDDGGKKFGSKSKKAKVVSFHPYSDKQNVIRANILEGTDEGVKFEDALKKFKGQVLYVNLTPRYRYAISPFDSVYNDCDTEYRIGLYDNTMTRGGFLGKTAVLTQGLDDEKSAEIVSDIQKWLGAENSSAIYHLDVETADNLDDVLKIIQVESQYDDAMFDKLQARIRRNILGAANNIPEGLVFNDNTLFGTSGDAYTQMKVFYTEQTEGERLEIDKSLKLIGSGLSEIIPFIDIDAYNLDKKEQQKTFKDGNINSSK